MRHNLSSKFGRICLNHQIQSLILLHSQLPLVVVNVLVNQGVDRDVVAGLQEMPERVPEGLGIGLLLVMHEELVAVAQVFHVEDVPVPDLEHVGGREEVGLHDEVDLLDGLSDALEHVLERYVVLEHVRDLFR